MMKRSLLVLAAVTASSVQVHGWTNSQQQGGLSRRDAMATAFGVSFGAVASTVILAPAQPALAAGAPPSEADIERLKTGYKQLEYLLDNFEQETTICRENGGECKRNADAVRKALGLRSTTDPLFQVDKIFEKVKYMNLDGDKLEPFFEATEDWNSAMNMSNSMAFISQFGEYNPGGGKDQVLKYLNESETQVTLAKKSLKTIIDALTS